MQHGVATKRAGLFDLAQDARGAALGALFEGAQAVEHAGVAGKKLSDGAGLRWLLEDRAFDDWRNAQELAGAGVDHDVDAVLAKGDAGFELAAAGFGVGVAVEVDLKDVVEVGEEIDHDPPQPQQRPQGRVDHRCQNRVCHGQEYDPGFGPGRIWRALSYKLER